MDLLLYTIVIAYVAYAVISISVRLYLVWWLKQLDLLERYNGLHVYAVGTDGTRWHVDRPLFTLYKHIKDPSISELTGQPPNNPREIMLWNFTRALPDVLFPRSLIRALRGK